MQYLALVNRARRECGVSGADFGSLASASSIEGQRFKDWVAQGWQDVQMARTDWQWMRTNVQFNTTIGQATYTATQAGAVDGSGNPNAAEWLREHFRAYLASGTVGGEMFMTYWDYNSFRDLYEFNAMRLTQSRPMEISVKPDHSLTMWPTPSDVYTIRGEYYRLPSVLAVDTDDPASVANGLPERFHLLIVAKAMRSYAAFESAPEVDARGMEMERRYLGQLESWGLQRPSMGGSL